MAHSPWGTIQESETIEPGVRWVSTPGHGGLMVSLPKAYRRLSDFAWGIGERYGDYLAFEEDVAYAAVYRDVPAWARKDLEKRYGNRRAEELLALTDAEMADEFYRKTIVPYYPLERYVAMEQHGKEKRHAYEVQEKMKVGDVIRLAPSLGMGPLRIQSLKPLRLIGADGTLYAARKRDVWDWA